VGLRQGELLGLAWADVDLEAGTLTVRNALQRVGGRLILIEPKSVTSRRVVALPDIVVWGLRTHRVRQAEERLRAGRRWVDDPRDLVFRTTIGTPLDGISVTRSFQALFGRPRSSPSTLPRSSARLCVAPSRPRGGPSGRDGNARPQSDCVDPEHLQPCQSGPRAGGSRSHERPLGEPEPTRSGYGEIATQCVTRR
jgi:hypothetical protein